MSIKEEPLDISCQSRPFTCDACGTSFKHKKNILKHIKLYHANSSTNEVSYHINKHSKFYCKGAKNGDRPYTCSQCNKSFKQRHHLSEHELYVHTTARPYSCFACDQTFKLIRDLRNHEVRVHKKIELFGCSICGLKSEHKLFLRAHISRDHKGIKKASIRTHREESPGSDSEDIPVQSDKDVGQDHEETATIRNNRTVENHEEAAPVRNNTKIENHEEVAPVHNRKVSFDCGLCDAEFRLKRDLREHKILVHKQKKLVHKKNRLLTCDRCGDSFKQRRTFEKHLSNCGVKQSISSDVIDTEVIRKKPTLKKISSGQSVARNKVQKRKIGAKKRNVSVGERPYRCEECGNSFRQVGHLHEHVLYVHGDERPFGCTECDRTFKRARSLRMHMFSAHGIVVPYMCRECGSGFKDVQLLRRHSLSVHGNIRAIQRNNLRAQEASSRANNQNKLFRCGKCTATFELSVSLSRHFKKEHAAYTDGLENASGKEEEELSSSDSYSNERESASLVSAGNTTNIFAKGCNQSYPCPACSDLFGDYGKLIDHARKCKKYISHANRENADVTRSRREFGCSVCSLTFDGARLLNTHLVEEHNARLFIHYCDFSEKKCPEM